MIEERIAKIIARSGYCSRREAEKYILERRVKINNDLVVSLATKCNANDQIYINEELISKPEQTKLWLYNKRVGELVTSKDDYGRKTIFDNLPLSMKNLKTIGRLDQNTEGLLLLTNDGELARYYELPKNKIERIYKVKIFGKINNQQLNLIKKGITVNSITYQVLDIVIEKETKNNSWLRISLNEGKNREIRNIFKFFSLPVNRLIRIQYGDYKLGLLAKGEFLEVDPPKII